MSIKKHNTWSRIIPPGVTQNELKNRLIRTPFTLIERFVLRLILDSAPPPEFIVTVRFICDSCCLSEKVWARTRDKLISAGLLTCGHIPLSKGERQWYLNFDFTPLAAGILDEKELSTYPQAKPGGGDCPRARDPSRREGSLDPAQREELLDPSRREGSEPLTLNSKFLTNSGAGAGAGAGPGLSVGGTNPRPADFCAAREQLTGTILEKSGAVLGRADGLSCGLIRDMHGRLFSQKDSANLWHLVDQKIFTFARHQ